MRKQRGLSLVELMIAILLGLLLLTGVMKIFVSSKTVFATQQAMSRIQESGRLAIDFLARDLRMAGYYGPSRSAAFGGLIVNGPVNQGLHGDFTIGLTGFDSPDQAPANSLGAQVTPLQNTSVVVVRAAGQQGVLVTQENTAASLVAFSPIKAKDSSNCVGAICENSVAVVADGYKSYIFQVSTLEIDDNVLTVKHAASWGGDPRLPLANFISGAEILPVNTTVYFLAKNAQGVNGLYQRVNDSAVVELLQGVENMRVTYSLPGSPNFLTAAQVNATPANWNLIQTIRIELLVASLDENAMASPQTYNFAGADVTPTDRRMRQVFTTIVTARSRMTFN
ncbi:MAG TPA: PilW family protein [Cellvibrio sp.]|nr:PilW family protein [Cellvibrio sp.]